MLYDLWYDGFLPTTFSIEQLLDVLLCDIGSHKVLIESYCDIFTSWYKDNNRILKDTKNLTLLIQDIQKSDQTAIDMLVDMLDVCSLTESN